MKKKKKRKKERKKEKKKRKKKERKKEKKKGKKRGEKKGEKKRKKEKITAEIVATNVVASRPPNGDRLQRRRSCQKFPNGGRGGRGGGLKKQRKIPNLNLGILKTRKNGKILFWGVG